MKTNRNFGKLKSETEIEYGPIPLTVITHHKVEEDVPVYDPETGEPVIDPETGEQKMEHIVREWDTSEVKIRPTEKDYRQMGFKSVSEAAPSEPAPEGYHYEARGYAEDENRIWRVYEAVANPLPTVADFDFAMEEHLRKEREARGYTTREPDAYLESSNARWRQDAHDWVAHRDAVMSYALDLINAVDSGEREPPTMAEFKAGLPTIVWPVE